MKKNIVLSLLLTIGLISSFVSNSFSQKCTGEKFVMPKSISVNNDGFANYLKIASLPTKVRQVAFNNLSNEQKASFIKVQYALQLVKNPYISKEQRDGTLKAISRLSIYSDENENIQKIAPADQNKVKQIEQRDISYILSKLLENKDNDKNITLLLKYQYLQTVEMSLRNKLANEMPIDERVDVWRTQLAYHLANSPLNEQQKEFIASIIPNVQSIIEASTKLSNSELNEFTNLIESNIFKVFTKAEAHAILGTIGFQDSAFDNYSSMSSNSRFMKPNYSQLQLVKFALPRIPLLNIESKWSREPYTQNQMCQCRWYCSGSDKTCGSTYCIESSDGCGTFGGSPCTNPCNNNSEEIVQ